MDTCIEWVNVKCKFFYSYGEKMDVKQAVKSSYISIDVCGLRLCLCAWQPRKCCVGA